MTRRMSPNVRRFMFLCLAVVSICMVIIARRGDVLGFAMVTLGAVRIAFILRADGRR